MSGNNAKDLTPAPSPTADGIRDALRGKFVCPFCGSVNDSEQGMCPRCTMENSAATRKATKTRIGPWYVLQTRNPAAPGMTWETLVSFIRKGRVKPRSIVRGPTTHQLWRFAAHVKGLSREFGICYSCGTGIDATTSVCPTCNRLQDPPPNPDALLEQSREAQQVPGSPAGAPPATVMGTVTLTPGIVPPGSAPAFGNVPPGLAASFGSAPPFGAAEPSVPPPPPPEETEFVIPAFGANAPVAAPQQPASPATVAGSVPAQPSPQPSSPATVQMTAAPDYTGLQGDASWAKIGATAPRPANTNAGVTARSPFRAPAGSQPPAPAAPNGFNPYAADDDNPAAPANNRPGEGFLSAKDLAAAFNLSFLGENDDEGAAEPSRPAARGGRPTARPDATAAALAATMTGGQSSYNAGPKPSRPWAKIILVLLLLGGASAGVALAVSPELRQMAKKWGKDLAQKVGIEDESSTGPRPKRPASQPSTAPSATTVPTVEIPGTSTQPSAPPTIDLAAARGDAFRLYQDALTLERNKPEESLKLLDKAMQSYPREAWPADLEIARNRVAAKVAKLNGRPN